MDWNMACPVACSCCNIGCILRCVALLVSAATWLVGHKGAVVLRAQQAAEIQTRSWPSGRCAFVDRGQGAGCKSNTAVMVCVTHGRTIVVSC